MSLGSKVTVMENGGNPEVFKIVGAAESSPDGGRISNESPLGRSLMGHRAGDWVVAQTPDGPIQFEILDVA